MKKRIADIIADTLVKHGITTVFSVVGGGAMFLNDALGHHEGLEVKYMNHEQACSMAAEGYVRATGKMAAVCVTSGPGGTNALTGVLGAFQDNYPILVISGQVKYENSIQSTGLNLRFLGEQEHNIVDTVKNLTKYATMVSKPENAVYEIEKAIYIADTGRRGPCWVDVPLNIQGGYLDDEAVRIFEVNNGESEWDPNPFLKEISKAKRPVVLTGSALRSSHCVDEFYELMDEMKIPVLTATYNADVVNTNHPYYFGNFGVNGGRAGNFIVQNADLIIGMGCRMAFRQIGFNYPAFAPKARKLVGEVDNEQLKKPTLSIDVAINEDIVKVIKTLNGCISGVYKDTCGWLDYCKKLKERFPVYLEKFEKSDAVNPYYFNKELRKILDDEAIVVLGNSSIAGQILQMGVETSKQRIINNMNCGSMGYDLPASIGAAVGSGKEITLITGDGSIQMNLQELQTIIQYNLPVKIFVCNNGGYRAIVRTQKNFFNGRYTGCSPETGVGLPNFEKIAMAYGFPYIKIKNHAELPEKIKDFYQIEGYALCEIMQDYDQAIEPRIMSKQAEDGSIISPPLDDLYPFLDEEIYEECQFR